MSTGYWKCATDCEGCEDCTDEIGWDAGDLAYWNEVSRMHDAILCASMLPSDTPGFTLGTAGEGQPKMAEWPGKITSHGDRVSAALYGWYSLGTYIADSLIPAGAMVEVLDNGTVAMAATYVDPPHVCTSFHYSRMSRRRECTYCNKPEGAPGHLAMATSPITPANCMHPRVFNLKCVDCGATALHTFSPAPDPNVKAVAPLVTKCPCGRSGCPDQKMHEIYEELRNRGKQLDEPCEGLKCRTNGGALDSGKFTCIVCGWKWELLGSRWTCMPRINVVAATISTEPALVRCKGCNASSNYARNHHLQLCWDCAEKR